MPVPDTGFTPSEVQIQVLIDHVSTFGGQNLIVSIPLYGPTYPSGDMLYDLIQEKLPDIVSALENKFPAPDWSITTHTRIIGGRTVP